MTFEEAVEVLDEVLNLFPGRGPSFDQLYAVDPRYVEAHLVFALRAARSDPVRLVTITEDCGCGVTCETCAFMVGRVVTTRQLAGWMVDAAAGALAKGLVAEIEEELRSGE